MAETEIGTPGPATQCVSACSRYDVENISGGCCVCNGVAKVFSKAPAVPNLCLCK